MQNNLEFEKIVQQVVDKLPADLDKVRQDIKKNLTTALQSTFSRLELVTREEFDIQSQLLSRARTLLGDLEKKIGILEQGRRH